MSYIFPYAQSWQNYRSTMALQKMCLDVIVGSFGRFNHAYNKTKNKHLRRSLLFLQRVYSSDLLEQLIEKRLLRKEYFDFVYNKYLKSLNTDVFSLLPWKTCVEIVARIGPSLEEVVIPGCARIERKWKDFICHVRNVKKLTYIITCNDSILQSIALHCPKLEKLFILHSENVTNQGLACFWQKRSANRNKALCLPSRRRASLSSELPCPLLKEIRVDSTHVKDDAIEELLENLPSLEVLAHPRVPIVLYAKHKHDLESLDNVKRCKLTHLDLVTAADLYRHHYDDILKVCFTVCPNLTSVSYKILKLEHLDWGLMLSAIEDLELCCDRHSRLDISDFIKQRGGKLTSLHLRECTVAPSALGQCCLTLKDLMLFKVNIQYDDQDDLPVFDNLESFWANHVDLSDRCKGICSILRSSVVLRSLHIQSCEYFPSEILRDILESCKQCPLINIEIHIPSVEEEILKDILVTWRTLKHLDLIICGSDIAAVMEDNLSTFAKTLPNKPKVLVDFRICRRCSLC